jgi:hypothetical protein
MKAHLLAIAAFICFGIFVISQSDSTQFSTALVHTRSVDTTWAGWSKEFVQADFVIAGKTNLVGSLTHEFDGYPNEPERQKMRELSDRDYKVQMWRAPNFKVRSLEFLNAESPNKPLKRIAVCTLNNVASQLNDYLSLELPIVTDFTYNLFANVERKGNKFNFSQKVNHDYRLKLDIPKGYELVALPDNMEVTLSEESGRIQYLNFITDNKIHVTARIKLLRNSYNEADYALIRQYYQKLLAKKLEITLLRKEHQETAKK